MPPTRNLQLPPVNTSYQSFARAAPQADPYTQFNTALLGLLQRHQSLGTKRFQEQGFNAQQEQNERVAAQTPADLIGASPGIQSSARSASAGAVDPTIQQANQATQTFGEQVRSYGDTLTSAKNIIQQYQETQNKNRDDARAVIKDAFTIGGADSLNKLDAQELSQLEKAAGYPKGYIQGLSQTLKERELELRRQQVADRAALGGLTSNQINSTVNQIAGAFDNEPIVRNYNTAQEGYQTIKSIGTKTSSPADDIAFIYSFAKIMDPNSVVREGEYNTIQRYAQTWADNFGFKAKRIFSNTNFLSVDAKQKMLNTLEAKIKTLGTQYQNVYNEYQRQVQGAYTGQRRDITDYSKAFPISGATSQSNVSGIIRVRLKSTGQTGSLPANEFDPTLYDKI